MKNVHLAKKFTVERNGRLQFDAARALRSGMSSDFVAAYTSALESAQTNTTSGGVSVFAPKKGATMDCLIAMLGISVATAALVMAVVATAGVAAGAVLGFGVAGVSLVRACY